MKKEPKSVELIREDWEKIRRMAEAGIKDAMLQEHMHRSVMVMAEQQLKQLPTKEEKETKEAEKILGID